MPTCGSGRSRRTAQLAQRPLEDFESEIVIGDPARIETRESLRDLWTLKHGGA
jgi:hypothetical protein